MARALECAHTGFWRSFSESKKRGASRSPPPLPRTASTSDTSIPSESAINHQTPPSRHQTTTVSKASANPVRLTTSFYVMQHSKQRGIEFHGDDGSLFLSSWQEFDAAVELARNGSGYEPRACRCRRGSSAATMRCCCSAKC